MSGRKILVVDNSEFTCSSFKGAFTAAGYKSFSAKTGQDALRLALFLSPDLIILDLLLEGLDGLKILSLLRQMKYTKNIPVILTSSSPDKNKIVTALKMGISGFLTKPIEMPPAIYKVNEVLEKSTNENKFPPPDSSTGLNTEYFKSAKGNLEDLFKYLIGVFNLLIAGISSQNKEMMLATLAKVKDQQGDKQIDSVTHHLNEMKNKMLRNNWEGSILELESLFFLFRELYIKQYPREK